MPIKEPEMDADSRRRATELQRIAQEMVDVLNRDQVPVETASGALVAACVAVFANKTDQCNCPDCVQQRYANFDFVLCNALNHSLGVGLIRDAAKRGGDNG